MWSMKKSEKRPTGILQENDKIRKLILDHPELPLVFSGWDKDGIMAEIGEVLDCQQEINDEIVFTDREDFEEEINQNIYSLTGYDDRPEEWYQSEMKRIASEYQPYWKPCILILVGD